MEKPFKRFAGTAFALLVAVSLCTGQVPSPAYGASRLASGSPDVQEGDEELYRIIGSGAQADNISPYGTGTRCRICQMIYTADEVGRDGKVAALAFDVVRANGLANNAVRVYLGHTAQASFASAAASFKIGDLTKVFDGTLTLGAAAGWESIEVDTPFEYEKAKGNLAVVVARESGYNGGSYPAYGHSAGASNRLLHADSTFSDPASVTSYLMGNAWVNRPNIRLQFKPVPAGVPAIAESQLGDAAYPRGCPDATPLSVTVRSDPAYGEVQYQWYKATGPALADAVPVPGATGSAFTPSTDSIGETYYFCEVSNNVVDSGDTDPYRVRSPASHITVWSGTLAAPPVIREQPAASLTIVQPGSGNDALRVAADFSGGVKTPKTARCHTSGRFRPRSAGRSRTSPHRRIPTRSSCREGSSAPGTTAAS